MIMTTFQIAGNGESDRLVVTVPVDEARTHGSGPSGVVDRSRCAPAAGRVCSVDSLGPHADDVSVLVTDRAGGVVVAVPVWSDPLLPHSVTPVVAVAGCLASCSPTRHRVGTRPAHPDRRLATAALPPGMFPMEETLGTLGGDGGLGPGRCHHRALAPACGQQPQLMTTHTGSRLGTLAAVPASRGRATQEQLGSPSPSLRMWPVVTTACMTARQAPAQGRGASGVDGPAVPVRRQCLVVPVVSADGGVGRSTLTLAVGGLLASALPGPVLAVDATGRPFSGLRPRSLFRSPATAWDVFQQPRRLSQPATARQATQTDPNGLHILVAEEVLDAPRRPLSLSELGHALEYAWLTYHCLVLDLPPYAPAVAPALTNAAGVLVVCRASTDSIGHAQRLLSMLARPAITSGVYARHVVAVNATTTETPRAAVARIATLSALGATAIPIPYDPGLAGGPVAVERLRRKTRTALADVAGALLGRATPGTR
jgi:MinD-like ATPase involved in chromosome partitioning or flagellar assembly